MSHLAKDREVDSKGNCSKCGGTHYGSYMCPMNSEESIDHASRQTPTEDGQEVPGQCRRGKGPAQDGTRIGAKGEQAAVTPLSSNPLPFEPGSPERNALEAPRSSTNVDGLMEEIQEFASTWSLVGTRLDNGNLLDAAERQKSALRAKLTKLYEGNP